MNEVPSGRELPFAASEDEGRMARVRGAMEGAGMVFHIPPALRDNGRVGVGISETVLVTPGGCEVITQFDRKLFVR